MNNGYFCVYIYIFVFMLKGYMNISRSYTKFTIDMYRYKAHEFTNTSDRCFGFVFGQRFDP